MRQLLTFCLLLVLSPGASIARKAREPRITNPAWTQPIEPFRIAGNLYYVGTADLGCYLVTTLAGHILINTGVRSSRKTIQAGMEKLGFKLQDIKILTTTQVHFDHVGAMAEIKRLTGAQLMVDSADAPVMEDGGSSDYEFGGRGALFQAAGVDRRLRDGDTISLGGTQLVILHHPGHTKGSCSFMMTVRDSARSYRVLIANMPTIIVERGLNEVPAYPEIAADYVYTLRSMKALQFDLWVASHASQFNLASKRKPGDPYNPAAFSGRKDYDAALEDLERAFKEKRK